MNRLKFNEMSEVITNNFTEDSYAKFSKLCIDTAKNDVEVYSVAEANAKIREKLRELCGVSENPTPRELKRAFRKESTREAVFEIIEDTVDDALISGARNNPVFQKYVDLKTLDLGDTNQFYIEDDAIITVSEIADGHHSLVRQRVAAGREITVPVKSYGAKVYMEMSRFLQGVEDWAKLIGKITEAFNNQINQMVTDAIMGAGASLPSSTTWNKRGLLQSTNHDQFVKLIRDVQLATGSDVTIVGTKAALAGLGNLGSTNWIGDEIKSDMYHMGRLGVFEGTDVLELPQAFKIKDVTNYVVPEDKILIMPNNIDKFIKMFYEGADETREISEAGVNADDTKEYEFKTRYGIKAVTNTRFGTWTIGA